MTVVILAEKPSAKQNLAKALGGTSGVYNGVRYSIESARGHLLELAEPHLQVSKDLAGKYKRWALDDLPWDETKFIWKMTPSKSYDRNGKYTDASSKQLLKELKPKLQSADEIVIATDFDPSGEGGGIAWNILEYANVTNKKITRMKFLDESVKSLRKAFEDRYVIKSADTYDEYRKYITRSRFDFLTIQFSRAGTLVVNKANTVIRMGRLKSAMVGIVGDGLRAHNEYVKKPFFQNRFKDDMGVIYVNPNEPQLDKIEDVDNKYSNAHVINDGSARKTLAPRKFLDLAALSSLLNGQGIKAQDVLSTYQRMYEAKYVSYPRTEDRTITTEQFNELLPLVDSIARVVGVDPALLDHRTPRKTHVQDSGAHGANRPGLEVPNSLAALDSQFGKLGSIIYKTLALSFLASLASDYEYDLVKGHLQEYPDFKGSVKVPKVMGWKQVFAGGLDTLDDDDDLGEGLGSKASPFIFEGANKRPPHPTMKWLMTQLAKYDVGTGATRTSTYAEVTKVTKNHTELMKELPKGRVTLSKCGEVCYHLLPGTKIGDIETTAWVYKQMKDVASGKENMQNVLSVVKDWVRHDIKVMSENKNKMKGSIDMGNETTEYVQVNWDGEDKRFKRKWGNYTFTDDEIERLKNGEEIQIETTSKSGSTIRPLLRLGEGTFNGKEYFGVQSQFPLAFGGYEFTRDEAKALKEGEVLYIEDKFISKKSNKKYNAQVKYDKDQNRVTLVSFDAPTK